MLVQSQRVLRRVRQGRTSIRGSSRERMNTLEQDIQTGVFRVVAETFPDHAVPLSLETRIKQDLGADSMQLIRLMIALEAGFDAEFPVDKIPDKDVTLEWICRFVHDTILSSSTSS